MNPDNVPPATASSTLRLRIIDDVIRISVTDAGHGGIVVRTPTPQALGGGRSLFIVNRMALSWGTRQTRCGAEIWFDLPVP